MANLQKPIRQMEQRLGETSREILRIESHIRRGEKRAASARIDGVRDQIASLRDSSDTALQLAVVGGQLGLLSGGGSWLRGRLPAAMLCAVGGWMYGQSVLLEHKRELDELADHLSYLEDHLDEPGESQQQPQAAQSGSSTG